MAIFDLMVEQTLGLYETKEFTEIFEPMFEELGVEIEDYEWEMNDLETMQDLEYVRAITLGNLIYAAQDVEVFPGFMDADDFDFSDGIKFDISNYEEDEVEEIESAIEEFMAKTGLKIDIEA